MSVERWEQVKRVVGEALARSGEERAAYLEETCAGDATLRAEVDSLLRHDGDGVLATVDSGLVGSQLGHYRVIGELGRGGMGRVYRAVDPHLGREVAVKVLPEGFAADPDRVKRFEREARLIASLNHPGIAMIHGLERSGEAPFIILELVEGGTLRERLRRGPLPQSEALDLARQIAEALEAAHAKGVVHRDLKPSNVALTEEGVIKLLDFGLAKALSSRTSADQDSGPSAEAEPLTTREGVLLGTPLYMSPEQVGGARVDHRSDIWSFGVLLWEMLAGRRPFDGGSTSEILGAVLRDEPDWAAIPPETPPGVVALLRRCLTREKKKRLQAIGEARILLEDPSQRESVPTARAPISRRSLLAGAAIALALGAALGALWTSRGQPQKLPVVRSALLPPPDVRLRADLGFALSPDGSRLAFVAQDGEGLVKLWVRALDADEARPVPDTEGAEQPFWSPDGTRLGFFAMDSLRTVAEGGSGLHVLAEANDPRGGTWASDGRIVYAPRSRLGLFAISESQATPEQLTRPAEDELSHRWPSMLPDGQHLVYLVQTAEAGIAGDRSRIELLGLDGERRELLSANSSAQVAPSGHLLFWREGSLFARPFAAGSRTDFRGPAQPLLEGVGFDGVERAAFSVGPPDSVVFYGDLEASSQFEIVEEGGRRHLLDLPAGRYMWMEASPDGRFVAYLEPEIIWILDLSRGTRSRVTFENVDHYNPTWSPDGQWLAYAANAAEGPGGRILRQSVSGAGDRELLYRSENRVEQTRWSPDGRSIVFQEEADIFLLDLESRDVRPLAATERIEVFPRYSPDGRWLSFCAYDTGRSEVYVMEVTGDGRRWPVSREGACLSRWSPSGDRLFFLDNGGAIRSAAFQAGAEPVLGSPEPAFPGIGPAIEFEFLGDGRLIRIVEVEPTSPPSFTLIQNWTRLLGEDQP